LANPEPLLFNARLQRKRKTSTRASKSARIRKPAISFVVRPLIGWYLPQRMVLAPLPRDRTTSFLRNDLEIEIEEERERA
jgi:hypothetical protein